MGSCSVNEIRRQQEICCGGDAGDLHEPRSGLIRHDQTETCQRHAETGVRSGKPDVTVERKLPAACERSALKDRDGRIRMRIEPLERLNQPRELD